MKNNNQIFLKPSYLVSKDMEASFYHDTNMRNNEAMNKLKSNMSLDFGAAPTKKRATQTSNLLNSPDLNLLKLASPELERLIIQQSNGMVTTTPTPTQFMNPKFVTEEQEEYARGFVNALTKLHENEFPGEGMPMSTGEMPVSAAAPVSVNTSLSLIPSSCNNNMTMADISGTNVMITTNAIMSTSCYQPQQPDMGMTYSSPATTMLPPASQILPVSTSTDLLPPVTSQQQFTTLLPPSSQPQQMYNVGPIQPMETERVLQLKQEDPQTVPNLGLSGLSPPMSPINMEVQEKVKLERKRERNRVAARKCRTRKLERISRLEDRVSDLKGQNSELVTTATKLRDQVARLKTQIMEHMNTGCKVMIGQDLL